MAIEYTIEDINDGRLVAVKGMFKVETAVIVKRNVDPDVMEKLIEDAKERCKGIIKLNLSIS